MKLGLGCLRYTPDTFWRLSLPEFFCAVDGFLESKGVRKEGSIRDAPTQEEMDALFAQLDDEGRMTNG
jgi:uncharacterized phage protein (TIGR02216 family)